MENDTQKIKLKQNKMGFYSVILGIVGLSYVPFLKFIGKKFINLITLWGKEIWELSLFVFGLITFTGLIFGILGLKSPKRKLAILGIILSLIGLLIIVGFNLIVYVLGPLTF